MLYLMLCKRCSHEWETTDPIGKSCCDWCGENGAKVIYTRENPYTQILRDSGKIARELRRNRKMRDR